MPKSSATGLVWESRFLDHILSPDHPEGPQRLRAVEERLVATGQWQEFQPIPSLPDPLLYVPAVHTDAHIRGVSRIPISGEVAALACAGALGAVTAVAAGEVRNAFCALRPPGHHAHNAGGEEGFCFYNTVAVAARYAQNHLGLKKILIVDWDFHHGNGTQDMFYEDPSVYFFSTHRWAAYPGTGDPSLKGRGDGYGFNVNVDLKRGAEDKDILRAFDHFQSEAQRFKPDLVLISAGFDSRKDDPLGDFRLTDPVFGQLTRQVMEIARDAGHDRVVSFLEGGYNPEGLALATAAHLEALQRF